tara:strand:- start:286 stop:564 length:279 start_codon:yes stop_codon:yes gene_type:complete
MDTPEKKPKTPKQETELDAKSKRRLEVERISKHIHPHNDEPDPTAYMGNYNFPQMLFAFCVGFCTMFVLFVDELNDFKGCPLPEYFQNEVKG